MNPSTETRGITRKQIADDFDAIDQQVSDLNDHKRELLVSYRAQLTASGMGKDEIKGEVEAIKAAIKRRRAVAKEGALTVEEKDALVDEVFAEITSPAPRATRVATTVPDGFDPETGEEITEPQEAQAPAQAGHQIGADAATSSVENEAAEISTPIQPETANEAGDDLVTSPGTATDHGHTVNGNGAINSNAGGENGQVTSALIDTLPSGSQPDGLENDRDVTRADASELAFGSAVESSAPIPFTTKPLRPYCLNPGNTCGGMGRKHCFKCQKAHDEQQGAA